MVRIVLDLLNFSKNFRKLPRTNFERLGLSHCDPLPHKGGISGGEARGENKKLDPGIPRVGFSYFFPPGSKICLFLTSDSDSS